MYIETTDSIDNLAETLKHIKRYSVIGNDQTFKQYTKNHAYENMNFAEKIPEKQQDILTVSLKDLEQMKSPEIVKNPRGTSAKKISNDEGEEAADLQREQYRIVKKDLLF